MINIRKDLIQEELDRDINIGFSYKKLKLSNKFIDRLFNHYYCHEMVENWFDYEPDYDELEHDKYMTYCSILEGDYYNYCDDNKEYPIEELKQAYINILQQRRDYEPKRIEFNNWIDVFGEGIWGMSQHKVDEAARDTFTEIKKSGVSLKDRLYFAEKDNMIVIYFYGRDFMYTDYWMIFMKRKNRKK